MRRKILTLINILTCLCIFIFIGTCFMLTGCQKKSSQKVEASELLASKERFEYQNYWLNAIIADGIYPDANEMLYKTYPAVSLTWGEVKEMFDSASIYFFTKQSTGMRLGYRVAAKSSDIEDDESVVLADLNETYGAWFICEPDTYNAIGYIKTESEKDVVPWMDVIAYGEEEQEENNRPWSNTDVSANLFELISGKYLHTRGAGSVSNSLNIVAGQNFSGTAGCRTPDPDDISSDILARCHYTGSWGDVKRVSDYVYSVSLGGLEYAAPGKKYYEDETLYITCEPFGFTDCEKLMLYLPGCKKDDIPTEHLWYIELMVDEEWLFDNGELLIPCFYNVNGMEGFILWDK